jgi:alginate O-acetyltransferase complex protein AlgI
MLVIEKGFLLKLIEKTPRIVQHFYTLFFVLFGWLLFVSEDLGAGITHLGNMFGIGAYAGFISQADIYEITRNLLFFAVMIIGATPLPKKIFYKFYENYQITRFAAAVGGIAVLLFSVAYLVDNAFNPFLYFRF